MSQCGCRECTNLPPLPFQINLFFSAPLNFPKGYLLNCVTLLVSTNEWDWQEIGGWKEKGMGFSSLHLSNFRASLLAVPACFRDYRSFRPRLKPSVFQECTFSHCPISTRGSLSPLFLISACSSRFSWLPESCPNLCKLSLMIVSFFEPLILDLFSVGALTDDNNNNINTNIQNFLNAYHILDIILNVLNVLFNRII